MPFIGYARVSTRDQDLAGQLAELEAFGCERSYHEKESGARSDRPQLRKAISRLARGDVLVVTRLDRLARFNPRLAQPASASVGAGRRLQKPQGCLGRHHERPRKAHADHSGRTSRV